MFNSNEKDSFVLSSNASFDNMFNKSSSLLEIKSKKRLKFVFQFQLGAYIKVFLKFTIFSSHHFSCLIEDISISWELKSIKLCI